MQEATVSKSTDRSLDNSKTNPTGYTYDVGRVRIFAVTFIIDVFPEHAHIYASSAAGLQNDLDSRTFARALERAGLPATVYPQLVHEARELAERDVEIDLAMQRMTPGKQKARPCMFAVTPAGVLFEVWVSCKETWAVLRGALEQLPDDAEGIWFQDRSQS